MPYDMLLALAAFAFVTSVTPGPNNLMLMASGANFGLSRSLRHILGIEAGFALMILLVGLGLAQLFLLLPWAKTALQAVCLAYLFWLAWKLARATAPSETGSAGTPMSFWQAAAFQWVNPKAWTMSLAALGAYAPGSEIGAIAAVAGIFAAVGFPSAMIWVGAGRALRRLLHSPARLRAFNWAMAGLLVASTLPLLG